MSNDSTSTGKNIVSWSAWSFIGVILAGAIFYWQEYREDYGFSIEVNDVFNLIEVRESISDLKVIYKGQDIVETNSEIKVARITLRNTGETILQSFYDNLEDFGIELPKSNILQVAIVDASSKDLERKIAPLQKESKIHEQQNTESYGSENIVFEKVIFEKGDYVTIKVVLMQRERESFSINPLGKIANINNIGVVYSKEEEKENERMKPLYSFLGVMGGILLLMIGGGSLAEYLDKKKKRENVDQYLIKAKKDRSELSQDENKIIDLYLKDWTPGKESFVKRIMEGEDVLDIRGMIKEGIASGKMSLGSIFALKFSGAGTTRRLPSYMYSVNDTKIGINDENREFINDFFGFVINQ